MRVLKPPNKEDAGWKDDRSYLVAECVESRNGKKVLQVYRGVYWYEETEYSVHITEQTSGRYTGRGVISALGPDGRVVEAKSKRPKKEALKTAKETATTLETETKAETTEEKTYPATKQYIRQEVYIKDVFCEESVKKAVKKAVHKLYAKYSVQLRRMIGQKVKPDTITPQNASALYIDSFIEYKYSDKKDGTKKNYRSRLVTFLRALPAIPMREIKPSVVERITKQKKLNNVDYNRLRDFWQYCLDRKYAIGENPFSTYRRRKKTSATRQREGITPGVLSLAQQDAVFIELLKGTITGSDCGIALQLWGGLEYKTAAALCWKEIRFDSERKDIAIVELRKDNLAGATHNYSKPLCRQAMFSAGSSRLVATA